MNPLLVCISCQLSSFMFSSKAIDVTYDEAAFIHVISALVMPRSRPAKLLITVIEPDKKLDIATAIVTDITKRHSCSVDLKHSGRAFGSLSLIGGETLLLSAASFSGSVAMCAGVTQVDVPEERKKEEQRVRNLALCS
jgi:hypothetical protein